MGSYRHGVTSIDNVKVETGSPNTLPLHNVGSSTFKIIQIKVIYVLA